MNHEFDQQSHSIRDHPVSEAVPEVMAVQVLHFGELRIPLYQLSCCSHRYRPDFLLAVAAFLAQLYAMRLQFTQLLRPEPRVQTHYY
jgi:hypothetical protein